MKTFRDPEGVHPPVAAYVHQAEINGPQRWLMLSGQIGMRQDGSLAEDPIEQVDVAMANIQRNLEAAGMGMDDLVKMILFVVPNSMEAAGRQKILTKWLKAHKPCMTLIYVAALASPAIKIEIDATACADIS